MGANLWSAPLRAPNEEPVWGAAGHSYSDSAWSDLLGGAVCQANRQHCCRLSCGVSSNMPKGMEDFTLPPTLRAQRGVKGRVGGIQGLGLWAETYHA